MYTTPTPDLSIIIPILNEADILAELFASLSAQTGIAFELILADGGSTDSSLAAIQALSQAAPFLVRTVTSEKGRGRQMNRGAAVASAELLLFLHADSRFIAPDALLSASTAWQASAASHGDRLAGHFRLRFDRQQDSPCPGYYFYEWKARLHRPGCTHGDQGLLLSRRYFSELGGFPETYPLLEDVLLARTIDATGQWLLLPAELHTSARRFEREGLRQRQTLNALIMNFAHIGWDQFLEGLPELYRNQDRTRQLDLMPVKAYIDSLLAPLPVRERMRLWYATGRYVRSNAWQPAFALDARRAFRRNLGTGIAPTPLLNLYDRFLAKLIANPVGNSAAMVLTWLWFRLLLK